jgi:phosphate starvation-inducible PhoH-like protein
MKAKRSKKANPQQQHNLSLATVTPLTENQKRFFKSYDSGNHQVLLGFPGTGKTFSAMYKAFENMQKNDTITSITIVRSAVSTRDQGHLPGTLQQKEEVYEAPYKQVCNDLFGRGDAYEILKQKQIIRFMSTSYVRGITLDNTVVIMDEFQSANMHELDSIITRIGLHSRMIFSGDLLQSDLHKASERKEAGQFLKILENMPNYFDFTYFTADDIVRSALVKEYIIQKMKQ